MQSVSKLAGLQIGPGHPVRIMAVVNVSPESFYKGSVHTRADELARTVDLMCADGADIIDVGAMSSAPYLRTQIPESEEGQRLEWAVKIVKRTTHLPISIDSMRSGPAQQALAAGGHIINDISGFQDPAMPEVARRAQGVVLMAHPTGHRGKASADPMQHIKKILAASLSKAKTAGIGRQKIILDPGIGFFRNMKLDWWQWDLKVLRELEELKFFKVPFLVGISRKSFIGKLLGGKKAEERLYGSLGATISAVLKGASVIRTHDVGPTRESIRIAEAIEGSN